jgi:hypothetical protein
MCPRTWPATHDSERCGQAVTAAVGLAPSPALNESEERQHMGQSTAATRLRGHCGL